MERDKIIAIALAVGLVFMFVALIGVITITGFVLFFVTGPPGETVDSTPILDSINAGTNTNTGSTSANTGTTNPNTSNSTSNTSSNSSTSSNTNTKEEPDPVCGNGDVEKGEECESDSDCGSNEECGSCTCVTKEPEQALLEDIELDELVFWCARDFEGESGLAVKIFKFTNDGDDDFSYDGKLTITAETPYGTDSIQTNNAYDFSIDKGKTTDIYQKDLLRSTAPYLFLGNKIGDAKITVEFGDDYFIEYEFTLRGQDFADAYCQ